MNKQVSNSSHIAEISKKFRFEAAHRLPFVEQGHKCGRLHGHSFYATVCVRGHVNQNTGWFLDFSEISKAFAPLLEKLDHNYLNEVKGLENPTSENIALWIIENMKFNNANVHYVTVEETCTSSCTVYAKDILLQFSKTA